MALIRKFLPGCTAAAALIAYFYLPVDAVTLREKPNKDEQEEEKVNAPSSEPPNLSSSEPPIDSLSSQIPLPSATPIAPTQQILPPQRHLVPTQKPQQIVSTTTHRVGAGNARSTQGTFHEPHLPSGPSRLHHFLSHHKQLANLYLWKHLQVKDLVRLLAVHVGLRRILLPGTRRTSQGEDIDQNHVVTHLWKHLGKPLGLGSVEEMVQVGQSILRNGYEGADRGDNQVDNQRDKGVNQGDRHAASEVIEDIINEIIKEVTLPTGHAAFVDLFQFVVGRRNFCREGLLSENRQFRLPPGRGSSGSVEALLKIHYVMLRRALGAPLRWIRKLDLRWHDKGRRAVLGSSDRDQMRSDTRQREEQHEAPQMQEEVEMQEDQSSNARSMQKPNSLTSSASPFLLRPDLHPFPHRDFDSPGPDFGPQQNWWSIHEPSRPASATVKVGLDKEVISIDKGELVSPDGEAQRIWRDSGTGKSYYSLREMRGNPSITVKTARKGTRREDRRLKEEALKLSNGKWEDSESTPAHEKKSCSDKHTDGAHKFLCQNCVAAVQIWPSIGDRFEALEKESRELLEGSKGVEDKQLPRMPLLRGNMASHLQSSQLQSAGSLNTPQSVTLRLRCLNPSICNRTFLGVVLRGVDDERDPLAPTTGERRRYVEARRANPNSLPALSPRRPYAPEVKGTQTEYGDRGVWLTPTGGGIGQLDRTWENRLLTRQAWLGESGAWVEDTERNKPLEFGDIFSLTFRKSAEDVRQDAKLGLERLEWRVSGGNHHNRKFGDEENLKGMNVSMVSEKFSENGEAEHVNLGHLIRKGPWLAKNGRNTYFSLIMDVSHLNAPDELRIGDAWEVLRE